MRNFKESKMDINSKGKKERKQETNKEDRGNKGGVKHETLSYTHSECLTCTPGSLQLSV
jgi:hypothetical protein